MPRLNPDKRRLCGCGCGELVPLIYDASGRFKGYAKGIPGHRRKQWMERSRASRIVFLEMARKAHIAPIGTKRLHNTGSTTYYVIKVADKGKWPYEHRIVMSQMIGRSLTDNEHVHHRNHDTLDNRPDNLELLTAGAHSRLHHSIDCWSRLSPHCRSCGLTTSVHSANGICSRCYQRRRKLSGPH